MWYNYIGENICGWRLVRKHTFDEKNPFNNEYNFINHKGEFISDLWFTWASNFVEKTQMAVVHLQDGNVYTLDTHGKLFRKSERTLEGKMMDEIADAISSRWVDTFAEAFLLHPQPLAGPSLPLFYIEPKFK